MVSIAGMFQHYRQAFDDHQARVLAEATVQIEADLVRREDFSELTATVGRLAGGASRHSANANRRFSRRGVRLLARCWWWSRGPCRSSPKRWP